MLGRPVSVAGGRLFIWFALAHLVFALWPGIDLAVSGLFYRPGAGFVAAGWPGLDILRRLFWGLSLAMLAVALVAFSVALVLGQAARVQARVWGFVVLGFLLGPGILVDVILKANWGRARPADIAAFGGTLDFTQPFVIAGQCARNCSFVSGEAAGTAMAALIAGLLGRHLIPAGRRWQIFAALVVLAAVAGGLRVITGRHFVSDVVFAAFLMAFVAFALYRTMGIAAARHSLTGANLRADLAALRRIMAGLRG